jgi:hypothetical protein
MDPAPVADRTDPAPTGGPPAGPRATPGGGPGPRVTPTRPSGAGVISSSTPGPSVTLTDADLAAIRGLQRLHGRTDGSGSVAEPTSTGDGPTPAPVVDATPTATRAADEAPDPTVEAARCPIPGVAALAGADGSCPVLRSPGDVRSPGGVRRSRADLAVRRLLRIQDRPVDLSDARTYKAFQRSMGISAVRCTLTYVIFPFVLPALNFATGFGPWLGILIGSIALVCDTLAIRRFFAVDHRYRWHFSVVALAVMALLTVLLVQDVTHIVANLTG